MALRLFPWVSGSEELQTLSEDNTDATACTVAIPCDTSVPVSPVGQGPCSGFVAARVCAHESPVVPQCMAPTFRDCVKIPFVFLGAMFGMVFILNFVHSRLPDPEINPPLRDIGFDILPMLRIEKGTDIFLLITNVWCIAMVCFLKDPQTRYRAWFRHWWSYTTCVLLRTVTTFVTSLPATDNHCQEPRVIHNIWYNTIMGVVTLGSGNIHCGDLLFSGHTICMTTAVMTLWTFGRYVRWWFRPLAVFFMVCTWFTIIASRSHYTVDVVVAAYVAMATYKKSPETIPSFLFPLLRGKMPPSATRSKKSHQRTPSGVIDL